MISNKDKTKFVDTVLTLIGLIFFLVGLGIGLYYINILQDCIEVEGTILSIYGEKTQVVYELDGKYFTQYINESNSSYYVGKEIELLYSIETKEVYTKTIIYLLPILFSSIGLIFLITGFIIIGIKLKNKRFLSNKHKYIKRKAKVIDIRQNNIYSVNNKHPYQLICLVNYNGENIKIKSPNFWDYVTYEKYYVVDVYFKNKKKYIVDLSSYRKDELFYEMEEGF